MADEAPDANAAPWRRKPARFGSGSVVLAPTWVLTLDQAGRLVLRTDHEIVVVDDRIDEIRPARATVDQRIDLPGQVLLPGFISAHSHTGAGALTRGYVEGNLTPMAKAALPRPGRQFLRAMELMDDLTAEDLDSVTALSLLEMLRSGCTTQVEMSTSQFQMQSYVRMAVELGARGFPSAGVPTMRRILPIWKRGTDDQILFDSVPQTLAEIAGCLDYGLSVDGAGDGRIRPMMAIAHPMAHTPQTVVATMQAAERLHGLHIHLQAGYGGPPTPVTEALHRLWGLDEIPWLSSLGMFDGSLRIFGAHLLGIDFRRDLPILAACDTFTFANCPSGTGAGVTPGQWPWPEALAAGVNSGIGLDTHSNDYLENLKLAVIYGRARADLLGDTSAVPMVRPSILTAIEAATLSAAKGLGRPDLGRIQVGAQADLITVDVSGLLVGAGSAAREPLNHLMYANGLAVRNVMVAGRWQLRDGRAVAVDEARLRQRAGAVVAQVWDALDTLGVFHDQPTEDHIPAGIHRHRTD